MLGTPAGGLWLVSVLVARPMLGPSGGGFGGRTPASDRDRLGQGLVGIRGYFRRLQFSG
jgi:hypothetical protein